MGDPNFLIPISLFEALDKIRPIRIIAADLLTLYPPAAILILTY